MKSDLIKNIKLLNSFFQNYVLKRKSLFVLVLSIFVALGYIKISTPKFLISTEVVMQADESKGNAFEKSGLASILTGASDNKSRDEFIVNAYSISNAQYLWDLGYAKKIFSEYYNKESNTFSEKRVTLTDRLASFIVGYEIDRRVSVVDLQNFIRDEIKVLEEDLTQIIAVHMWSSDPILSKDFLKDFIKGADSVAKENALVNGRYRVDSILQTLNSENHPQVIREGLIELANRDLFKITSAQSNAPLSVTFIQEPISSQNPVTPRPFLIIMLFILVFQFFSYFASFLLKNKHDIFG